MLAAMVVVQVAGEGAEEKTFQARALGSYIKRIAITENRNFG